MDNLSKRTTAELIKDLLVLALLLAVNMLNKGAV